MSGQLKEVRGRISSVKSTQQITKAMKMVSAAKLRKAQQAIVELRPYAERLDKMLKNILSNMQSGDATTSFGIQREVTNACIVVITSDRGLCGGFNTNIVKAVKLLIEQKYQQQRNDKKLDILFVGKKGYDACKKKYVDCNLITDYISKYSDLSFANLEDLSKMLMDSFSNGTYDSIHVCYSRFKNAAVQEPEALAFLPVVQDDLSTSSNDNVGKINANYIFEPGKNILLEHLIPSILQITFQKCALDTNASEHGARMTAMDKATENAEDMINDLKIFYNKARQEAITKELSEIVGGAAALGG